MPTTPDLPPTPDHPDSRRRFLRRATHLTAAASAAAGWPLLGRAAPAPATAQRPASADRTDDDAPGGIDTPAGSTHERRLWLVHTHTHERLHLTYAVGEHRVPAAMQSLERFLRDHYSGAVGRIDPQLFDLLHRLQLELEAHGPFEIVSGYRAPATNARLRERGGGVARGSLHMAGQAIDLRLRGVALADLRDAALALRAGGVGFYARERFVHLDTGRVRRW